MTGKYALVWRTNLAADGTPAILTHNGSNGFWVATVRIATKQNVILLITTNAGNQAANTALTEIVQALKDRLEVPK